jgi:2-polyprenyl-6-methoxyphenol hydroxylase-like FAD-dependent oxidoreductase
MVDTPRGTRRRGLIIGCGMAGPVLAMFLERAGIEAVIYESRTAPRDGVGSFLGIAPNGRDVLSTLGIGPEIEALGMPSPKIAFLNHHGKQLGVNPQPVVTFKRGRLTAGLRNAALEQGVRIHWDKRLSSLEQDDNGVTARFEDGSSAQGDFLVGCDGTFSRVRGQILPNAPTPEYTEIIGTGAYTRVPGMVSTKGTMYMTFCLNGFFGYQVNDDGEVWWFENYHRKRKPEPGELEEVADSVWLKRLLELHKDDHQPIPKLLESTDGEIVRWAVSEMPMLSTWHKGRVCLAGDSAHATGPHTGQGGSMAFEDAIVLAKCLRDIEDVTHAFEVYEQIRKQRVEHVVKVTRRTGSRKAPPGLFGRLTRDLVLPFFLKQGVSAVADIHDYHIVWDERILAGAR